MKIKDIPNQLSIYVFLNEPPKFHEAEWLIAKGYKNIYYEQPPKPGVYEWTDINTPTKTMLLEYTSDGHIYEGWRNMGTFRAVWWREVKK